MYVVREGGRGRDFEVLCVCCKGEREREGGNRGGRDFEEFVYDVKEREREREGIGGKRFLRM